jgi:anaerobic selenocysteine-containing dehydrogenase
MESISGLSADEVRAFVTTLRSEPETGVFFCASFGGIDRTDLAAGLAALLAEATGSRFLGMPVGANAIGVRSVLSEAGFPSPEGLTTAEMIEACATGDIKALLVLGGDPIAAYPGYVTDHAFGELDLLVVTSVMPGETTAAAHVMLPSAAWGEKDGVMSPAFEGELDLGAALIPPGAARSDKAILEALSKGLRTAKGEARPAVERAPIVHPAPTAFFDELEFHFRMERRDHGAFEAGTHMLLPRNLAAHSGDGWLTRHFSWSGHECKETRLSLSPEHAAALGVAEGAHVRIRSRESEAVMGVRLEERVPKGVVLAPPHCPEVRRLMRWQLDPVRRDVDLRPNRVSVEALSEDGHDH